MRPQWTHAQAVKFTLLLGGQPLGHPRPGRWLDCSEGAFPATSLVCADTLNGTPAFLYALKLAGCRMAVSWVATPRSGIAAVAARAGLRQGDQPIPESVGC